MNRDNPKAKHLLESDGNEESVVVNLLFIKNGVILKK